MEHAGMSDDIQKETERIHQGIVESLSFSEALAKRDAEIERLRERVTTKAELLEFKRAEIERLRSENERLWSLCRNVYGSDKYIREALGE